MEVHRGSGDESARCCLHVTIRDAGVGIPPEKQRLVWEPFAQADSSTARRHGGTGLGLTISSKLVQLMGGRLWLESKVGVGTTVHFTVLIGVQPADTKVAAPEFVDLAGMAVLVVDDNATNRRILEGMLRSWHMRAAVAASGAAALRMLQEGHTAFDLLLLDVHMPEMDGFALVEQIRARACIPNAMVAMLSSAGQRSDGRRCRELGIGAYLLKPIRNSDLLEAIQQLLSRRPTPASKPALITRHSLREGDKGPLPSHPLRILLAEDNAINQKLAQRLLEKDGHSVTIAAKGLEAVRAVQRDTFDLVLMDVQMPEMDGCEATAAIRRLESQGHRVPIFAMTAHAMVGDRERCLAAGMDGYISKPIHLRELREVVAGVGARLCDPSTVDA